jgi:hypothetical protein
MIKHWLAHLLGVNKSVVYTWWDGEFFYVAYRCVTCNKIQLVYKSRAKKNEN